MKTIDTKNKNLYAYIDGQMSDLERRAFEEQVAMDPNLSAEMNQILEQNAHIDASILRPDKNRLKAIMYRADKNADRQTAHINKVAAVLALTALSAASGYSVSTHNHRQDIAALQLQIKSSADLAVAAHALYSVEVVHPVEVAADENKHLTKWLSKRLGQPITAPDITQFGFFLVGGRLVPSGDDPAAQFMYENEAGERMTLFATVTSYTESTSLRYARKGDVIATQWRDGLWDYTIVGEMNRGEMERIANQLHLQLN